MNPLNQKERLNREIPYLAKYLGRYIPFISNIPKSGVGIEVAKNGLIISYLILSDDYIVFYKATTSVAQNIKAILKIYVTFEDN